MDITEFLETVLYPALFDNLDTAFPEFGWIRKGRGWQATNENYCHSKLGHHASSVVCNKPFGWYAHGQRAERWLEYQANGIPLTGQVFTDTVRALCAKCNLSMPEEAYSPAQREAYETRIRKTNLLEDFWLLCKGPAKAKDRFCIARKISGDAELGYIEDVNTITERLQELGYSDEELLSIGLLGSINGDVSPNTHWSNRVIGVVRGRGAISGFFGRVAAADNVSVKYLYSTGFPWGDIVLTNWEYRQENLVIVEGVLEPIIFKPLGLNMQALGGTGAKLHAEHWPLMVKRGVKTVTLFLDNDEAGLKGLESLLAGYDQATKKPALYLTFAPDGMKDADEVRLKRGIEKVQELLKNATHHLQYRIEKAIDEYENAESAIAEAELLEKYVHLATSCSLLERERYLNRPLAHILDISKEALDETVANKAKEQEELKQNQTLALAKAEFSRATDLKTAASIADTLRRAVKPRAKPSLLLSEQASSLKEWLVKTHGKDLIGLPQRTLPSLDKNMLGLRGVILVPGPPNVGKSAFCHQMGVDCVKASPNVCYVYLALEMSSEEHYARMICRFSGLPYEKVRLGKLTPFEEKAFENAEIQIIKLGTRIKLLDKSNFAGDISAEDVTQVIKDLKAETGCNKCVLVVDYLQRWPVPAEIKKTCKSDLEVDDWRMEQIELLKSEDEPVFVISQQTKGDNVSAFGGLAKAKGSSSNVYTPDAVWFLRQATDNELWPHFNSLDPWPAKKGEGEKALEKPKATMAKNSKAFLFVEISKGRDGMKKCSIPITFDYSIDSFEENWSDLTDNQTDFSPAQGGVRGIQLYTRQEGFSTRS